MRHFLKISRLRAVTIIDRASDGFELNSFMQLLGGFIDDRASVTLTIVQQSMSSLRQVEPELTHTVCLSH